MALLTALLLCSWCASTFSYVLQPPLLQHSGSVCPRTALRMEHGVTSLPPNLMPNQKTWYPQADDLAKANKKWFVVDAEGLRLGRMSSEIAKILLGKHKAEYTPGADVGDYVIVINCEKVAVTGDKRNRKMYRRHSGRPGGMKVELFKDLQKRIPERIVERAIKGMLPKNSHGRELFRHLKVYEGPNHPHESQLPEVLTFAGRTAAESTYRKIFDVPEEEIMANVEVIRADVEKEIAEWELANES